MWGTHVKFLPGTRLPVTRPQVGRPCSRQPVSGQRIQTRLSSPEVEPAATYRGLAASTERSCPAMTSNHIILTCAEFSLRRHLLGLWMRVPGKHFGLQIRVVSRAPSSQAFTSFLRRSGRAPASTHFALGSRRAPRTLGPDQLDLCTIPRHKTQPQNFSGPLRELRPLTVTSESANSNPPRPSTHIRGCPRNVIHFSDMATRFVERY